MKVNVAFAMWIIDEAIESKDEVTLCQIINIMELMRSKS